MIDPMTGWFKIVQYNDEKAAKIANLVGKLWIYSHTRPTISMYNHRNEFLGQALKKKDLKRVWN